MLFHSSSEVFFLLPSPSPDHAKVGPQISSSSQVLTTSVSYHGRGWRKEKRVREGEARLKIILILVVSFVPFRLDDLVEVGSFFVSLFSRVMYIHNEGGMYGMYACKTLGRAPDSQDGGTAWPRGQVSTL